MSCPNIKEYFCETDFIKKSCPTIEAYLYEKNFILRELETSYTTLKGIYKEDDSKIKLEIFENEYKKVLNLIELFNDLYNVRAKHLLSDRPKEISYCDKMVRGTYKFLNSTCDQIWIKRSTVVPVLSSVFVQKVRIVVAPVIETVIESCEKLCNVTVCQKVINCSKVSRIFENVSEGKMIQNASVSCCERNYPKYVKVIQMQNGCKKSFNSDELSEENVFDIVCWKNLIIEKLSNAIVDLKLSVVYEFKIMYGRVALRYFYLYFSFSDFCLFCFLIVTLNCYLFVFFYFIVNLYFMIVKLVVLTVGSVNAVRH